MFPKVMKSILGEMLAGESSTSLSGEFGRTVHYLLRANRPLGELSFGQTSPWATRPFGRTVPWANRPWANRPWGKPSPTPAQDLAQRCHVSLANWSKDAAARGWQQAVLRWSPFVVARAAAECKVQARRVAQPARSTRSLPKCV